MKHIDLRSDTSIGLLKRHMRAVVHMRQQKQNRQFGLVFGAGIGKDLGFPNWKDLVDRIAKHEKIAGIDTIENSKDKSTQTQLLYQKYRENFLSSKDVAAGVTKHMEMQIRAGWREVVHAALYENIPEETEELLKKDRYLQAYAEIIRESPLTVTYNFDDTIEKILIKNRKADEKDLKGYATYWSGNVQLNARAGGVVYHPNGFLPRRLRDRPSDHLVFLEDSFVDQLIDSMAGQYASLSTHVARTTCLFLGLSLDDPGLKHLLRQTAKSFPGHYHYYVRFVGDEVIDEVSRLLEVRANFESYNLITLHLTADELNAMAQLLSVSESDFETLAEEVGTEYAYRFYIVGAVSAGKSTTVSHFRSLLTQDEWLEERAPGMEKDPSLATKEEISKIDSWVAEQVGKKNVRLEKTSGHGIHVIDRAPLDAFAFTPQQLWREKAVLLRDHISPRNAKKRKVVSGHIIFLQGDSDIMASRAVSLHKETTSAKLAAQQDHLLRVYRSKGTPEGISLIDTRDRSALEVVKLVARVIFLSNYTELDLDEVLNQIKEHGYGEVD